jgi:hypothetical protein
MAPWVVYRRTSGQETLNAAFLDFAKQRNVPVSSVHIEDRGPWTESLAGVRAFCLPRLLRRILSNPGLGGRKHYDTQDSQSRDPH